MWLLDDNYFMMWTVVSFSIDQLIFYIVIIMAPLLVVDMGLRELNNLDQVQGQIKLELYK